MKATAVSLFPRFVDGERGQIFLIQYSPSVQIKANILLLPAIGEELNRCRKMLSDQARLLAASGFQCWVLDYFGTGDSGGDFAEIDWDLWLRDIQAVIQNTIPTDQPLILFGVRVGALMALDVAESLEAGMLGGVVLFQPVTSGQKFVNQMLRQRSAYLMANDLSSESAADMRAKAAAGQLLEVGGYLYNGSILQSLDERQIKGRQLPDDLKLIWMENVKAEGADLSIGSNKLVEGFRQQGCKVSVELFCDPPIWQLHERAEMRDCLRAVARVAGAME